ncbi:MarR family winged helix-turn-helix transcriptional regulator [Microbacterium sp. P05]|uniref:MarR family winged helix-turn-helix transcriptional regulator n=1 Tax=Microbacterium sp. P05 TaxID=3366948 RepID=UPI0037458A8B
MSARMSAEELRAWENFQTVAEVLHREVGRELWDDAQLSDAEFSVLAHLQGENSTGVRPSECARSIGWDSSRLSHQLRRLEKRGLVAMKKGDGSDGRATLIIPTAAGQTAYRRAIGPHLRAAKRWFADALTDAQVRNLNDVLDTLLGHTNDLSPSTTTRGD